MQSQRDSERAAMLQQFSVSRETAEKLNQYVDLLLERQQIMNLISPLSPGHVWSRHVADSLQLLPLGARALRWADLGSGAGFPGVVIACALADTPGAHVHLIESTKRKAAFLADVVSALNLPVSVHPDRIEAVLPALAPSLDLLTARAVAPLEKLLDYAAPALERGVKALFMKGQNVEAELARARQTWDIHYDLVASQTGSSGRILIVNHAKRLASRNAIQRASAK
jgi:16S rRNA (guanine527-N7)-methyltransferase